MGTSRMKLLVYHTLEPFSIESGCNGSQAIENTSQPEACATQPTKPFLLPCPLVTGAPLDDPTNEALNSNFDDVLDLYEGQYFSNKKLLKNKLTEITLKGNFEFRTRKSNSWLWVIECVNLNCSWRVRASKITLNSVYFVIHKYVSVHSCLLLNRNFNHH